MSWVRTDDSAPSHPKLVRAGAEACWFWQAGLCYSNKHSLNGRIAKDLLPLLYAPVAAKSKKLAAKLVEVGLWYDRGDHYEIHDYAQYQEQALKEAVEARREYERKRKRDQRGGTSKGQQKGHVPEDVRDNVLDNVRDMSQVENEGVPPATRVGAPAIPSRPDPSQPELERERSWTAEAQSVVFRKAFADSQGTIASMGGRMVGGFHVKVLETARLQNRDPRELFLAALQRWLSKPLTETERKAPYACFDQAWGDLTSTAPKAPGTGASAGNGGLAGTPETFEQTRARLAREIDEANRRAG